MTTPSTFRAIIVGGGPVGLTAAHSFSRAGIDFVVLEARDTCTPDAGSSLVLNPGSLRIFHQLGLEEQARAASAETQRNLWVDYNGRTCKNVRPFSALDVSIGQRPMTFHRQDVLRILHDNLSEKDRQRVLTSKKVIDVQTHANGVSVSCADGTSYHGSIVIGADGVHSKTRGFMRKLALAACPDTTAVNPEKPYTAHFKCMWGTVPIPRGLSPGDHTDCHTDDGVSAMFLTGRDKGWFFMFGLLDAPTQARKDYTDQDMEDFAKRLADLHISPDVRFGEVWASRYSAGMSNLDEGVLDHWSWERVVLMGDAAHKVTPNAGWGLNSGIQDVAVLANGLQQLLASLPTDIHEPTMEQLVGVFQEYQQKRRDNMQEVFKFSAAQTRQSARDRTWTGLLHRIIETVTLMIPKFDWFMLRYKSAKLLSAGYALDFIHGKEPFSGVVAWKHPIRNA